MCVCGYVTCYDVCMRKKVASKDVQQRGYVYTLTAPTGRQFHSDFKPDLTPKEMVTLGIMGGIYFIDNADKEYPPSWFAQAKVSEDGLQHKELNFFGVLASQSLATWQQKGWIYKDDPRGWIQWYFRYYLGRRIPGEDERQIQRWYAFRRHAAQVAHACRKGDYTCRPRQRQALLHWAYDSRKI